jgi:tetrahydromethanopterin S-methyltransferase subunit G
MDEKLYKEIGALTANVNNLIKKVDELEEKVDVLNGQASKWKGGLGVVLVFGGIVGGLLHELFGG